MPTVTEHKLMKTTASHIIKSHSSAPLNMLTNTELRLMNGGDVRFLFFEDASIRWYYDLMKPFVKQEKVRARCGALAEREATKEERRRNTSLFERSLPASSKRFVRSTSAAARTS